MTSLDCHDDLRAQSRTIARPSGDVLFEIGDALDAIHVVERGVVLIRSVNVDGDLAVVDVRGRGDVLDDSALLDGRSGSHYEGATAASDVQLLRVAVSSFEELCNRSPTLGALLVDQLTSQVRRLSTALVGQFARTGRQRAARCLTRIDDALARSAMQGTAVVATQRDLADYVGTTRSTLNAHLREFERAGAVSLTRGRIAVIDRAKLSRFV
jgi:CRP-like cAMP-binding protein